MFKALVEKIFQKFPKKKNLLFLCTHAKAQKITVAMLVQGWQAASNVSMAVRLESLASVACF